MAAKDPNAIRPTVPFSSAAEAAALGALPQGWSIVDYPGRRGKFEYAVYANGRRLASGMTSEQSAARWARLLATVHA